MGFGSLVKTDSLSQLTKSDSVSRLKDRLGCGPKEPKVIDISVRRADKDEFELSKEYEVASKLLVHSAEALSSPIVGEISVGSLVTVLRIGNGGRLQVTNALGSVQGWVSSKSLGSFTLRKIDNIKDKETSRSILRSNSLTSSFSNGSLTSRVSRASRAVSSSLTRLRGKEKKDLGLELTMHPKIGELVEAEGRVIVREEESMSSLQIMMLHGGCQLRILDYGKHNLNRVKVSVEGKVGWVSILDKNLHEPLFGKRPNSY